jgi:parvulin-like peptidyl-prolyl isomerase
MVHMSFRAYRACALVLAAVCAASAADTIVVEQIVAKVNGDIITRSDLDRLRKQTEAEMHQRSAGMTALQLHQAMEEHERELLRDKIDSLLLVQKGKELDLKVDNDVSKRLAEIQLDNKIADPDKFAQWVKENVGMNLEDFKAEMKNQLLTQRVIGQEVGGKINIPHEQIVDYYEKHKAEFIRQEQIYLREILVATPNKTPAADAAALKKAKEVVARARKGERYADLVRDNSDAGTAKSGGDIGAWKKGDLRPDMEAEVWDKPKGYVSNPIKVDAGYLILRVDEHYKQGQAALDEVESEVKEKLFMPLYQPKIREYLTELRVQAFLEIREGYVDTGAAPGKDTRWQDPAMLKPETVSKEKIALRTHQKYLLWAFPIPGTVMVSGQKSSSR